MGVYPNGRGNRLKIDSVWVRLPSRLIDATKVILPKICLAICLFRHFQNLIFILIWINFF